MTSVVRISSFDGHLGMKITGVKRRSGLPDRVFVYVDGALAFTMPAAAARESGICVGIGIDEETVARARIDSDPWLAKDLALKLLSHRPRSAAQLRARLQAKGFSADVVERSLADLVQSRYLDDEEFARAFVLGRIRARPRGRRVLLAELRARGIDAAVAAVALDQVLNEESVSDLDLARKVARRRRPRPGEDVGRWQRRIQGFLSRKGFGHDTVRQVIDELRPEKKPGNE